MQGSEEMHYVDLTDDGINETMMIFTDLSGDDIFDSVELYSDTNNDGVIDQATHMFDINGDGQFDVYSTEIDLDYDGVTDYRTEELHIDTNGNGYIDTVIFNTDSDNDGVFELLEIEGIPDQDMDYTLEEPDEEFIIIVPLDTALPGVLPGSDWDDYQNFDPNNANSDQIIGEPQEVLDLWEWQEGGTCAIHSQRILIEHRTGRDLDIEDMVDIAKSHGVYTEEGGTTLDNLDYMLDYYNVPNSGVCIHGTIDGIVDTLDNGGIVMVAVNYDGLLRWDHNGQPDGHTVVVIGYNKGDPIDPYDDMVIINDTGHPDGQGAMVPVQHFLEAWSWTNNAYVETYA